MSRGAKKGEKTGGCRSEGGPPFVNTRKEKTAISSCGEARPSEREKARAGDFQAFEETVARKCPENGSGEQTNKKKGAGRGVS